MSEPFGNVEKASANSQRSQSLRKELPFRGIKSSAFESLALDSAPSGTHPKLPCIVLICGDLMFQAKVQDTARHFKVGVHVARNESEVLGKVLTHKPALVLLDLSFEGVHPLKILEKLKSDAKLKHYKVIAFGPHVERDLFAAATHAGADNVMARSMFSANLAKMMGEIAETARNQ